jgi:hypothetical protein
MAKLKKASKRRLKALRAALDDCDHNAIEAAQDALHVLCFEGQRKAVLAKLTLDQLARYNDHASLGDTPVTREQMECRG